MMYAQTMDRAIQHTAVIGRVFEKKTPTLQCRDGGGTGASRARVKTDRAFVITTLALVALMCAAAYLGGTGFP